MLQEIQRMLLDTVCVFEALVSYFWMLGRGQVRKSPVPDHLNAHALFTYTWADAENSLHRDFELYSSIADVRRGTRRC